MNQIAKKVYVLIHKCPVHNQNSVLQDEVESGLHDENANHPEVQSERPVVPEKAITFLSGWKIPGVAEFALSLFFCKLVSYTFLYWLPTFILDNGKHNIFFLIIPLCVITYATC